MINAEFLWKKDPVAFRVTVKGHADTGKYGEDVVCAAVSALVQTLANKVQMAMRTGGATGMIRLEDGNCWTVEAIPTDETAGDVISGSGLALWRTGWKRSQPAGRMQSRS